MKIILALAFGVGFQINEPLRRAIEKKTSQQRYTVFTQHDLAQILKLEPQSSLITAYQSGIHVSSLAIIEQFARIAKTNNWTSVEVIAAKPHIWRCVRDLRKITPQIEVKPFPVKIIYCHDMWWWVRSPLVWWGREAIIRALPWSLYKNVCS